MNLGVVTEQIYKVFYETNSVQRQVAKRFLFPLLEPLGFHIVADHFYEPVPNLRELEKSYEGTALRSLPQVQVDFSEAEMNHTGRLSQYGGEFRKEADRFGFFTGRNRTFPVVDAVSLYCFLREKKVSRVIEVGQGFSTRVLLAALTKNGSEVSNKSVLVSIDPYNRLLTKFVDSEVVDVEIIQRPVQSLDAREFVSLIDGMTLVFIDSSHVFKPGSDVEYLMKEIYPRISRNTYVHIHDIYTPYPWPLEYYLKRKHFWDEQSHLENFLSFNDYFRVELPLFWLLKDSQEVNEQLDMLQIKRHSLNGASFYIKRMR
jgi:hypothetical protein